MNLTEFRELLSRHTRTWVLSGLGALAAVNLFFGLAPLLRATLALAGRNASLGEEIRNVKHDRTMEDRLRSTLEDARHRLHEAEQQLALGDVSLYLETLSGFAQETGVRLRSLRPVEIPPVSGAGEDGTASPYRRAFFEILANSGYHELGRFAARIESSAVLMKINRLQIRQNPDSPRVHDIEMDIVMLQEADENYIALSTP